MAPATIPGMRTEDGAVNACQRALPADVCDICLWVLEARKDAWTVEYYTIHVVHNTECLPLGQASIASVSVPATRPRE